MSLVERLRGAGEDLLKHPGAEDPAERFDPERATLSDLTRLARRYTVEAVQTIVEIMRTGSPNLRLKAAEIILTRGFGKPVETTVLEVQARTGNAAAPPLPPEEYAKLLEAAAEAYRRSAAQTVDITVEEVHAPSTDAEDRSEALGADAEVGSGVGCDGAEE